MNRIVRMSIAVIALIIVIGLILLREPRECQPLRIDQHDGVGTFVSFSRDPLSMAREPEVDPARIRARGGEKVTWVLRNPSDRDITVWLYSVTGRDPDRNIRDDVFETIDPPIRINKGCQIASLQGRLMSDLLQGDPRRLVGCDSSLVFHYFFMIRVHEDESSKGDSLVCEWPYDPELVIERDP